MLGRDQVEVESTSTTTDVEQVARRDQLVDEPAGPYRRGPACSSSTRMIVKVGDDIRPAFALSLSLGSDHPTCQVGALLRGDCRAALRAVIGRVDLSISRDCSYPFKR
jgi:hypothetical protein